jgi:hypothetical protein
MRHTFVVLIVSVFSLVTIPRSKDAAAAERALSVTRQQTDTELHKAEGSLMSQVRLAHQQQSQSEPGAGQLGADPTSQQTPPPDLQVPQAGQTAYTDPLYSFSIAYPQSFVVQPQDTAKLAQFTPTPVASIFFMNPTMAAGALAGVEPPDLAVRIYQAEAVDSLQSWLRAVGLASAASGATAQPYRNAHISGLKVCQATMLAPGCSVYVLHNDRVYQLTPISREGEAMLETFALLS